MQKKKKITVNHKIGETHIYTHISGYLLKKLHKTEDKMEEKILKAAKEIRSNDKGATIKPPASSKKNVCVCVCICV